MSPSLLKRTKYQNVSAHMTAPMLNYVSLHVSAL
jgi:hypothetical protein